MRVLFVHTVCGFAPCRAQGSIIRAFEKLNINYELMNYGFTAENNAADFGELLEKAIKDKGYSLVFSMGFIPAVSDVCQTHGIKYVSWVWDNPLLISNQEALLNSCNEVFFFDRVQAYMYAAQGVNAHHLPPAADVVYLENTTDKKCIEGSGKYEADIALAAPIYKNGYYEYTSMLEPYLKGYLEGIVNSQLKLYGGYLISELIGDDLVGALNQCLNPKFKELGMPYMEFDRYMLEHMLACEVTNRERLGALRGLGSHYDTIIYTDMEENAVDLSDIRRLRVGRYSDYASCLQTGRLAGRINLNITHKEVQSGIPWQLLDVMACSGFVLTNYQNEIVEYLEPGEACVIYESMGDLYEKAEYYLAHEQERIEIARRGREVVERKFTFEERIGSIFGKEIH